MSFSRRDFLEVSALSASGLALSSLVVPVSAISQDPVHQIQTSQTSRAPEARLVLNMNRGWQFSRPLDSQASQATQAVRGNPRAGAVWERATLPHTVRLEQRDVSGGQNYQGLCWYRRTFTPQPEWKGRVIYLKFHGAMQVADVWLNGEHLTTHYGGYLPFTLDISKVIRFNTANVLALRLDNSDNPEVPPGKPQNKLDFVYFGGLYRSVEIEVLEQLHITDPILANKVAGGGIFVTFPVVDAAESTVQVQTEVANESGTRRVCTVTQELTNPNGSVASSTSQTATCEPGQTLVVTQTMQVRNPRLWHPDDPQLYHLHTTVNENGRVTDAQTTRIGIRSIQFEKDRGLLINGQPFFSIGANRHQDHPYVGYALPPSAHYRDALKLRSAGFNSYRSHYPQDSSFMDACDELGILAIVSNPGWQFVGDATFTRRVYQDAREMIRRDRNRPSVFIWEAALNESDNHLLAAELYRIVHQEFPGPACYAAGDAIRGPVDGFNGWDVGYVGIERKNPDRPSWIREWGDQVDNWGDQQSPVRVARVWGETPMLMQASAHLASLNRIYNPETKPAGGDLWAGIDAYRGYHHQPFLGAPLDFFRLPKFDYFMLQSQRSPEPRPTRAASGPMVFIASFATFQSPMAVTVYSNCHQVRLTQNNKVVATQQPDPGYQVPHPPFTFKVSDFSGTHSMLFANNAAPAGTEIGALVAEGLIDGKVVTTHRISSPGVPAILQLEVDLCGVDPVADGADWVRVYAHVCDARGTTHPYADDLITFSVTGEGAMIGDDKIFANPVRAEAGIATGVVRTTPAAGVVTVHASAPGLKEATAQFQSVADSRPLAPSR